MIKANRRPGSHKMVEGWIMKKNEFEALAKKFFGTEVKVAHPNPVTFTASSEARPEFLLISGPYNEQIRVYYNQKLVGVLHPNDIN